MTDKQFVRMIANEFVTNLNGLIDHLNGLDISREDYINNLCGIHFQGLEVDEARFESFLERNFEDFKAGRKVTVEMINEII